VIANSVKDEELTEEVINNPQFKARIRDMIQKYKSEYEELARTSSPLVKDTNLFKVLTTELNDEFATKNPEEKLVRRLQEFKVSHFSELSKQAHYLIDFMTRQHLEMSKAGELSKAR